MLQLTHHTTSVSLILNSYSISFLTLAMSNMLFPFIRITSNALLQFAFALQCIPHIIVFNCQRYLHLPYRHVCKRVERASSSAQSVLSPNSSPLSLISLKQLSERAPRRRFLSGVARFCHSPSRAVFVTHCEGKGCTEDTKYGSL